MPPVGKMFRRKNLPGIISVTFLVISLVSIVSFTDNPVKNLAIQIFARPIQEGGNVVEFPEPKAPPPEKVPTQKEKEGETGSTSNTPSQSSETGTTSLPGYTLQEAINSVETTANRTGTCKTAGCPQGTEISGFYKLANGNYYPIAQSAGGPSPSDLGYIDINKAAIAVTNGDLPEGGAKALCQSAGGNYRCDTLSGLQEFVSVFPQEIYQTYAKIFDPSTALDQRAKLLTDYKKYLDLNAITPDNYKAAEDFTNAQIQKASEAAAQTQQQGQPGLTGVTTLEQQKITANTSNQLQAQPLTGVTTPQTQPAVQPAPASAPVTITPTTTSSNLKQNGTRCTGDSDCGSGYCGFKGGFYACDINPGTVALASGQNIPQYGKCQGGTGGNAEEVSAACNYRTYQTQQFFNAITLGGFNELVNAYAPSKVIPAWQAMGYKSLADCNQKAGIMARNCQGYGATNEQIAAATRVGTTLVTEGALAAAAASGATAIAAGTSVKLVVGQVLTQGLAIQAQNITGKAAASCITNSSSAECKNNTEAMALSWLNVGALGYATKLASVGTIEAINSAKSLSIVLSGLNTSVSGKQMVNSCANKDWGNCALNGTLTVLMAGLTGYQMNDYLKTANLANLPNEVAALKAAPQEIANAPETKPPGAAEARAVNAPETPRLAKGQPFTVGNAGSGADIEVSGYPTSRGEITFTPNLDKGTLAVKATSRATGNATAVEIGIGDQIGIRPDGTLTPIKTVEPGTRVSPLFEFAGFDENGLPIIKGLGSNVVTVAPAPAAAEIVVPEGKFAAPETAAKPPSTVQKVSSSIQDWYTNNVKPKLPSWLGGPSASEVIVKQNADLILNPSKNAEYSRVAAQESFEGNAGEGRIAVRAQIDKNGNITSFGNIQDLTPEARAKLTSGETRDITIVVKQDPNVSGPKYQIVFDSKATPAQAQSVIKDLETALNKGVTQATGAVAEGAAKPPTPLQRVQNAVATEAENVRTGFNMSANGAKEAWASTENAPLYQRVYYSARKILNPEFVVPNTNALKVTDLGEGIYAINNQPDVLVQSKAGIVSIRNAPPTSEAAPVEINVVGRTPTTTNLGARLLAGDEISLNGQIVKFTGLDANGVPLFERAAATSAQGVTSTSPSIITQAASTFRNNPIVRAITGVTITAGTVIASQYNNIRNALTSLFIGPTPATIPAGNVAPALNQAGQPGTNLIPMDENTAAQKLADQATTNQKDFGIDPSIGAQTIGHTKVSPTLQQLLYENYYNPSPAAFLASGTLYGDQQLAIATLEQYRAFMLDQMSKGYVLEASGQYGYHPELLTQLQNFRFLYQNSSYDHTNILLQNEGSPLYSYFRDSRALNGQFIALTPDQLNPNQQRIYNFNPSSLVSIGDTSQKTPEDAIKSGKYIGIVAAKSANDLGRRFLLYKTDPTTGKRTFVGMVLVGDYAKRADWTGTGATSSNVFVDNPLGFRKADGQQWGFDLTQDIYKYFGGQGGPVTNITAVDPDSASFKQTLSLTIPAPAGQASSKEQGGQLSIEKIKSTPYGSNIPNPQFSSPTTQNPYEGVPQWFWDKVYPNINLDCGTQQECFQKYNALPLADGNGDIKLTLNSNYVPSNLVNMSDYGVTAATANNKISRAAAPMIEELIKALNAEGTGVVVSYGYRSYSDQANIRGDVGAGAALPGQSMHQSGLAIDINYTRANGAINPNKPLNNNPRITEILHKYGFVQPFPNTDPGHVVALDAVQPGLVQALINAGVNPDNEAIIKSVFLGIAQTYESQIPSTSTGSPELSKAPETNVPKIDFSKEPAAPTYTQNSSGHEFIYWNQYNYRDRTRFTIPGTNVTWADRGCGVMTGAMVTNTTPDAFYKDFTAANYGFVVPNNPKNVDKIGIRMQDLQGYLEGKGYTVIHISKDQVNGYTNAGNPVIGDTTMRINGAWTGHLTEVIGVDSSGNYVINNSAGTAGQVITDKDFNRFGDSLNLYAVIPPSP